MAWFGGSKIAASTSGTFGKFTRNVEVSGTCACGDRLSGTATGTTVLGESGNAVVDTTHGCGAIARLTGNY